MNFSIERVVIRSVALVKSQFLWKFLFATCLMGVFHIMLRFVVMLAVILKPQPPQPRDYILNYIPSHENAEFLFSMIFFVIFIIILIIVVIVIVGNVLYGGLIFAMTKNFAGLRVDFVEMLNKGVRNIWPLFLVSLPIIIVSFALMFLMAILLQPFLLALLYSILQGSSINLLWVGLTVVVTIGVMIAFMLRWVAVFPLKVIERKRVGAAYLRSAHLTRGHRGPIFGLFVLIFIVSFGFIVPISFFLLMALVPILLFVVSIVLSAFLALFYVAITVALYLELCCLDQNINSQELAAKLHNYYRQNPKS